MPLLWLTLVLAIIAGGWMLRTDHSSIEAAEHSTLDTISESLLVYRTAVGQYRDSHPGFTGTAGAASLSLPTWFRQPAGFSNIITATNTFVFYTQEIPGLGAELYQKTESQAVGINRSGRLITPSRGDAGIALPAGIPEGVVVLLQ